MPNSAATRSCLALLGAGGLALATPAQAQSLEELDRLSDLSATEEGGIAAAQDLASRGDLLQAIATLERVMAANPRSPGPRILHAFYLCAIDDLQGAEVELDVMEDHDIDEAAIDTVRGRCRTASSEFPATARTAPAAQASNANGASAGESANQQGSRAAPASASGSASAGQNTSRERPSTTEDGGEKD